MPGVARRMSLSSDRDRQPIYPFPFHDVVGRAMEFRPLFPASEPAPESERAPEEASQEEPEPQVDVQPLIEEWKAKLAEVDRVLQQARQRAEVLAKEAEERGYREGYGRGYEEGQALGMETAQRSLDDEVAKVRGIARAISQARQELLASLEPEIVSLALAIAKKVVGDEALRDETVIAHMVQKAVRQLGRRGPYRIRLNPRDAQRLMDRWRVKDELDGAEWELIPDERISIGGCVLESGVASVDARLETQFDLIQHALLEGQNEASDQELSDGGLD